MRDWIVEGSLDRRLRAAGTVALVALSAGLVALGLWLEVPWH